MQLDAQHRNPKKNTPSLDEERGGAGGLNTRDFQLPSAGDYRGGVFFGGVLYEAAFESELFLVTNFADNDFDGVLSIEGAAKDFF